MKNSIKLQKQYYSKDVAVHFDKGRMNANHMYKIETIESIFEKLSYKKNGLSVLDLGGGTGLHAEHFLEKESEYVNQFIFSDLSEDMLKVAQRRLLKYGEKVHFICSPGETFKLKQKVDCIYVSGAMHHFEDPEKVIENCYRYLSEHGILIICEPVITNLYAWPRVIFKPEEYGQFHVTSKNVSKWLEKQRYKVVEKKWLHYRSNYKVFRFLMNLEKITWMNWSAVMFVVVGRKEEE